MEDHRSISPMYPINVDEACRTASNPSFLRNQARAFPSLWSVKQQTPSFLPSRPAQRMEAFHETLRLDHLQLVVFIVVRMTFKAFSTAVSLKEVIRTTKQL